MAACGSSEPQVSAAPASPSGPPSAAVGLVTCGRLTAYTSDGAHALLTISSLSVATQYNLAYQSASSPPPDDIGTRFANGTPQLLKVSGQQAAPDSGSPNAVVLRNWMVARVDSCP